MWWSRCGSSAASRVKYEQATKVIGCTPGAHARVSYQQRGSARNRHCSGCAQHMRAGGSWAQRSRAEGEQTHGGRPLDAHNTQYNVEDGDDVCEMRLDGRRRRQLFKVEGYCADKEMRT